MIRDMSAFGPFPPVEQLLGPRTLNVLARSKRGESFIIHAERLPRRRGLIDCVVLVNGPALKLEQIQRLRALVLTPEAHYNGSPRFRRWPSVPNFAFRLFRGKSTLDVLIDLHNPGWEFHCGTEHYKNWNWVGDELVQLAHELFPRFASGSGKGVWKQGVMHTLKKKIR